MRTHTCLLYKSAHCFFSINIKNLVVNLNCFNAFRIQELYHIPTYTRIGISNFLLKHVQRFYTSVHSCLQKMLLACQQTQQTHRACATRDSIYAVAIFKNVTYFLHNPRILYMSIHTKRITAYWPCVERHQIQIVI